MNQLITQLNILNSLASCVILGLFCVNDIFQPQLTHRGTVKGRNILLVINYIHSFVYENIFIGTFKVGFGKKLRIFVG